MSATQLQVDEGDGQVLEAVAVGERPEVPATRTLGERELLHYIQGGGAVQDPAGTQLHLSVRHPQPVGGEAHC